jgi:hypothetical protein
VALKIRKGCAEDFARRRHRHTFPGVLSKRLHPHSLGAGERR